MDIYVILSNIPHSKHYLTRYVKFIDLCKNANYGKKLPYKESHHIIPKCLYKEYSSFKEHPWNKIDLTARQHYIAHWILWKIYSNNSKLQLAFLQFASWKSGSQKRDDYRFNSRAYEILKIEHSKNLSIRMKGRVPSENERKLASDRMKNRIVSKETREKLSLTRKTNENLIQSSLNNLPPPKYGKDNPFYGKKHSVETLKFYSESQKNVPLHVKVGLERSYEIRQRMSISNTGKRWWNNGITNSFSKDSPGRDWIIGRLNKGNLGRKPKYLKWSPGDDHAL